MAMAITFISSKKIRIRAEKDEKTQIVFISKRARTKNYILITDGKAEFVKHSKGCKND